MSRVTHIFAHAALRSLHN